MGFIGVWGGPTVQILTYVCSEGKETASDMATDKLIRSDRSASLYWLTFNIRPLGRIMTNLWNDLPAS